MRVFAVSDLHTDYTQNMAWLEALCASGEHKEDAIIVAGDITDDLDKLEATLAALAAAYRAVFFMVGNHELWVRKQERNAGYDSLGKLARIRALCGRLGVRMEPGCVRGVWVVPLFSWYHASWDREPDVPGSRSIETIMTDFAACSWSSVPGLSAPGGGDSVARHLDSLNDPAFGELLVQLEAAEAATGIRPPVISFSHFLPRQELLPEKRMLYIPNLAKAAGSDFLYSRIQRLRPLAHVFGHTHFSWDATLDDGVRYVQQPLGYPHEQSRRRDGGRGWRPLMLYDTETGLAPKRSCYWSDYYATVKRNPLVTQRAPWVEA